MARTKIAAGNWKMHGDLQTNRALFAAVSQAADNTAAEVMVFAPALYLQNLIAQAQALNSKVVVGAQNFSQHEQGAYTGEISAAMLKDVGCSHVLVGHSERRALYHETNSDTAEKYQTALKHGLMPVLCVGESLEQRQAEQTMAVVIDQIKAVGDQVGFDALCKTIIAYEPVWAIGTGQTATPQQAQEVHQGIRTYLKQQVGENANETRILYGGSVNGENAAELFAMADIDGGLVGGASLKAEAFTAICKAAG